MAKLFIFALALFCLNAAASADNSAAPQLDPKIFTQHPACAQKYMSDVFPCVMKATKALTDVTSKSTGDDILKELPEICCKTWTQISCIKAVFGAVECKDAKAELVEFYQAQREHLDTTGCSAKKWGCTDV